jgi:hypothetical protein
MCSASWHAPMWLPHPRGDDKIVQAMDGDMFVGGVGPSNPKSANAKTATPIPLPEHWRKGDPDKLQCFHKIKFRRGEPLSS